MIELKASVLFKIGFKLKLDGSILHRMIASNKLLNILAVIVWVKGLILVASATFSCQFVVKAVEYALLFMGQIGLLLEWGQCLCVIYSVNEASGI